MRRERGGILANIDWILVLLYLLLVLMGWGNIYAAVYNEEASSIFDITQKYGKQMLWIGTSLILIFIVMILDHNIYETLSYPIFLLSLASLLGVLLFGTEIAGARSWFTFGSFSIQPSEFAKFATCLALARYLSTNGVNLQNFKGKLIAFTIILLPAALIIPQPDPGSALVYTSLILVLYRMGLSSNYIFIGLSIIVLFILSLLVDKIYLIASRISGQYQP